MMDEAQEAIDQAKKTPAGALEELRRSLFGFKAEHEALVALRAIAGSEYEMYLGHAVLLATVGAQDDEVRNFVHKLMRGEQ